MFTHFSRRPSQTHCQLCPVKRRAEGGCTRQYSSRDLQHIRCYSCGKRGHLGCAAAPSQPPKLSCANCGQGGHTAGECTRELPQVMRGERLGAARQAAQQPVYGMGGPGGGAGCYSSGGGWGASRGGGGYQHGHRGPHSRYASYSAYAEIEQPGRRYDDSFDYDRGYGGGYKRQRR